MSISPALKLSLLQAQTASVSSFQPQPFQSCPYQLHVSSTMLLFCSFCQPLQPFHCPHRFLCLPSVPLSCGTPFSLEFLPPPLSESTFCQLSLNLSTCLYRRHLVSSIIFSSFFCSSNVMTFS